MSPSHRWCEESLQDHRNWTTGKNDKGKDISIRENPTDEPLSLIYELSQTRKPESRVTLTDQTHLTTPDLHETLEQSRSS